MAQFPALRTPHPYLPEIPHQRFKRLENIHRRPCESYVERCKTPEVLEVRVVEVGEDDLALWLELQKLEDETDERRGFLVCVGAAEVGDFDRAIEDGGGVETEALLFVVEGVEDAVSDLWVRRSSRRWRWRRLLPDDLLNQEEGVHAVEGLAFVETPGI